MSIGQKAFHEIMENPVEREGVVVANLPLASKTKGPGFIELWKHKRVLGWCTLKLDVKAVYRRGLADSTRTRSHDLYSPY